MNRNMLESYRLGNVPKSWLDQVVPLLDSFVVSTSSHPAVCKTKPQNYLVETDKLSGKIWSLLLYVAYHTPHLAGHSLAFKFVDGSVSQEHVLGLLRQGSQERICSETIILGAMSGRHREIDFLVEAYLHTNSDLSGVLRGADVERACAENTLQALSAIAEGVTTHTLVELIITGFEPMIIGTCRGVVQFLTRGFHDNSEKSLCVRLRYYCGGRGRAEPSSNVLSLQTRGAQLDDYYVGPTWG